LLVRRCSGFAGVSGNGASIENGVERLGLGKPPFTRDQIEQNNARTCTRALDRPGLRKQWADALAFGTIKEMTEGVKLPQETLRGFLMRGTIAALLMQGVFAFIVVFESLARRTTYNNGSDTSLLTHNLIAGAIAVCVSLFWIVPALWRLARHGT